MLVLGSFIEICRHLPNLTQVNKNVHFIWRPFSVFSCGSGWLVKSKLGDSLAIRKDRRSNSRERGRIFTLYMHLISCLESGWNIYLRNCKTITFVTTDGNSSCARAMTDVSGVVIARWNRQETDPSHREWMVRDFLLVVARRISS
jgi:hypothetical protein